MEKVILLLAFIFFASCTNQSNSFISDKEKNQILNEVSETANKGIDAVNKLDLQSFLGMFLNSPDFLSVTTDGDFVNYEQKVKAETEFFNSVSSLHLSKISESFKILSRNSVLYTLQFKVNAELKTGEKLTFEKIIAAEIYSKINGVWKMSFFQESGLAPIISK